jgi:hypothetical protein
MPTPPRGVDGGVKNEKPLTGGEAAEADDQLRERAKHALERAGNATLNAIHFGCSTWTAFDSVEVLDLSVDQTIPAAREVWVRVSTGKPRSFDGSVVCGGQGARRRHQGARVRSVQHHARRHALRHPRCPRQPAKDALPALQEAVVSLWPRARHRRSGLGAQACLAGVSGSPASPMSPRRSSTIVRGSDPPAPVDKDPFVLKADEQARPDDCKIDVGCRCAP